VDRVKALRWLKTLGMIVLGVVVLRVYQTRHWPSTQLTPLAATTLAGKKVSLPDSRPVIVHFWATWCGICQAEEGMIKELAKDARLVSIASLSGPSSDVERYVSAHGIGFDVIVDQNGQLAQQFGVSAYPTTLFVDADGDILAREVGYVTGTGLRARWWLAQ
jgi:thiol-disulfide isomerase/thioredoxin